MHRREFIALAGGAAAFPRVALAQQAAKVPHLAFVWVAGLGDEFVQAYHQGLMDYGYVEGVSIATQTFVPTTVQALPSLAANIVAMKPDVIVANGATPNVALKAATTTIPVVFGSVGDPISTGLTTNLSHPSGNFTGTTIEAPDLVGKQLGILREIIPDLKRIVALNQVGANLTGLAQLPAAAQAVGVEALIVDFDDTKDFTTQFDRVLAAAPQAVYVPASVYLTQANGDLLADLQIKNKLPLLFPSIVQKRALVGYGPNTIAQDRKTGAYIDAILKGAKPADLPIQQPTQFDLAVNLTTAKALGITIPPLVLAQATQVIQ